MSQHQTNKRLFPIYTMEPLENVCANRKARQSLNSGMGEHRFLSSCVAVFLHILVVLFWCPHFHVILETSTILYNEDEWTEKIFRNYNASWYDTGLLYIVHRYVTDMNRFQKCVFNISTSPSQHWFPAIRLIFPASVCVLQSLFFSSKFVDMHNATSTMNTI